MNQDQDQGPSQSSVTVRSIPSLRCEPTSTTGVYNAGKLSQLTENFNIAYMNEIVHVQFSPGAQAVCNLISDIGVHRT